MLDRWWQRCVVKTRTILQRVRTSRELNDEIAFHLDAQAAEYIASGLSPKDARTKARETFGSVHRITNEVQSVWGLSWLAPGSTKRKQIRRQLRRTWAFSIGLAMTIALCAATNVAVLRAIGFTMLDPLPVLHPNQIYSLRALLSPNDRQWLFSSPAFTRILAAKPEGAVVFAHSGIGMGRISFGHISNRPASFQMVSTNFFSALGVNTITGRTFRDNDDSTGNVPVPIVVNEQFADARLGGSSTSVGKQGVLNEIPVVVIGVTPRNFAGVIRGARPSIWLPLAAEDYGHLFTWYDSLGVQFGHGLEKPYKDQPGILWLWLSARILPEKSSIAAKEWDVALRPDFDLAGSAATDLASHQQAQSAAVHLVPIPRGERPEADPLVRPLLLLAVLAASAWLIAILAVQHIQLNLLKFRRREIAVRLQLKGEQWSTLWHLLLELLPSLMIGLVLAALAYWIEIRQFVAWIGRYEELGLRDILIPTVGAWGVLSLTFLSFILALCIAIYRNIVRGFGHQRPALEAAIYTGSRNVSMVVMSVVAFLLLSYAVLLLQAQVRYRYTQFGTAMGQVVTARLNIFSGGHDRLKPEVFQTKLLSAIRKEPYVEDAAMQVCKTPGCDWNVSLVPGQDTTTNAGGLLGQQNYVSPQYFRTMRIGLVSGREFLDSDIKDAPHVAVLNLTAATRIFGTAQVVGRYVTALERHGTESYQVVGVCDDAPVDGPDAPVPPVAYFPAAQGGIPPGILQVRLKQQADSSSAQIRGSLTKIDPTLGVYEIAPFTTYFYGNLANARRYSMIVTALALMAMLFTAVAFCQQCFTDRKLSCTAQKSAMRALRYSLTSILAGSLATVIVFGTQHAYLPAHIGFTPATLLWSTAIFAFMLAVAYRCAVYLYGNAKNRSRTCATK